MATPTLWKSQFAVNTGTASGPGVEDPHIIGLSNGNFLVAWTEDGTTGVGTTLSDDIIGKIYDAEGNVVKDSYRLNIQRNADTERDFDIAATNDGGFVIVYMDDAPNASRLVYERYDAAGTQAAFNDSVVSETAAADDYGNPRISINNSNNEATVTFTDTIAGNDDIRAFRFNTAGTTGSEFSLATNTGSDQDQADIQHNTNGELAVVHRDGTQVEVQVFTQSGTLLHTAVVDNNGSPNNAKVATLSNGNIAVTWVDDTSDVNYAVYNSNLGVIVAKTQIDGADATEPEIVSLPQGGFVVVWDDNTGTDTTKARAFTNTGATDGGIVTIDTGATNEPDIGVTGDGRLLFTWDTGGTIEASIWDPRGSTVNAISYDNPPLNFVDGDVIVGGIGATTINGDNGTADTILGQNGNDVINASGQNDSVSGGGGNDTIDGGGGVDTLDGDAGDDTFILSANNLDIIDGGTGTDRVDASTRTSAIQVSAAGVVTGSGPNGSITSIERLFGTDFNDDLEGSGSLRSINGGDGNDTITGADGSTADTLNGGNGNDTINGQGGEDSVNAGAGDDVIIAEGGDFIDNTDGGTGSDTLDYSGLNSSYTGAMVDFENDLITSTRTVGGTVTVNSIETYIDNDQGNTIIDQSGALTIQAGGGNDTVREDDSGGTDDFDLGSGNDTLEINNTGIGGDTFDGGTGTDLIDYSNITLADDTFINLGAGTISLGASSEIIANFENVIGSQGNEFIEGTSGNNTINGQSGDDTLRGGAGADSLNGGSGSDYADYLGNLTGLTADLQLAVNNTDIAAGDTFTSIENLRGTNFGDNLRGDTGANVIDARIGDDILLGRDGNDRLLGGNGNDSLFGGAGADTLDGGSGRDRAAYGDAGGAGVKADLLNSAVNTGIAAGDVYISIEDLTGSSGVDDLRGDNAANLLIGAAGNDFLTGRAGDDTLEAGSGDDLLVGGDGADFHDGSTGRDTASYADTAVGLRVDLANVALNTGFAAGDTYSSIEVIIGSGGDDDLRGDNGDNQLDGRNGDDFITGRGGDDDLRGGNGDDVIIGGAGADRHVGGAGSDTASYSDTNSGMIIDLASNGLNTGIAAGDGYNGIENLVGSGGNDDLRGDAGANRIEGRNGDDFIFGRDGNDNMIGGNGDDNLRGGQGGDTLNGGSGSDSANYIDSVGVKADLQFAGVNTGVAAGDSYISVENLFGSNGGDDLRGDANGNRLIGRDGDDFLTGRDGNDDLFGGNGDDVLRGGNGTDTLTGNAGDDIFRFDTTTEGADTIRDFQINRDTIVFDDAGFSSLSAGSLSSANFVNGTSASDGNDYVIYDSTTGDLFYDADGVGIAAQVLVANLQNTAAIDENDFLIV